MLFLHRQAFAIAYLKAGAIKGYWKMKDFEGLTDKQKVEIAEDMLAWEKGNFSVL